MKDDWLMKHRLRWTDLSDSFREEFVSHTSMRTPLNSIPAVVFEKIIVEKFGFVSAETTLGDRWGTFYLDDRDYHFYLLKWA